MEPSHAFGDAKRRVVLEMDEEHTDSPVKCDSKYTADILGGSRGIVVVQKVEHVKALYLGGFYGKGTLSRAAPDLSRIETGAEKHLLTPEEAFYLSSKSFGMNCLEVRLEGVPVDEQTLWDLFNSWSKLFPKQFIVYRHCRRKGWVPKTGLKFGSEFMLYHKGPAYFHSAYSVRIVYEEDLDWDVIHKAQRITGYVSKNLLFAFVRFKSGEGCLGMLESANVQFVKASRWEPETNRM